MPLSPNGKLDRSALPVPDGQRPDLGRPYVAPRTGAERELAEVWAAGLGLSAVGIHDDFFVLGGDSILSLRVLALARERGLHFSLQQLFEHRTVAALARLADLPGRADPTSLLTDLDQLSDEQVEALLAGMIGGSGRSPFEERP
jgi:aryl carrier-like protein